MLAEPAGSLTAVPAATAATPVPGSFMAAAEEAAARLITAASVATAGRAGTTVAAAAAAVPRPAPQDPAASVVRA